MIVKRKRNNVITKRERQRFELPRRDDLLKGKKVVVQTRRGQMVEGIYQGTTGGDLFLISAEITGTKYIVKVPFIFISLNNFGHIHPLPIETKTIEGGNSDA